MSLRLPLANAGISFLLTAVAGSVPNPQLPATAVQFFAAVTGGQAPYTYAWDFDDSGTSTLAGPTHSFAIAGIYNVSLVVTDALGSTSSTSVVQNILATGQTLQITSITATPNPATLVAGTINVVFAATSIGGSG